MACLQSHARSVIVALLCLGTLGASQCVSQNEASKIDTLMHTLAARGQFSGSVLVAEHGNVVYENGFGKADSDRNVPFTPATPCYLASLTKQFTAMAVMILAEEGKLSYDDRLTTFLPQFPAWARSVTIRHLLNHTSGMPDYVGLGLEHAGLSNDEVYKALLRQDSLDFRPGEQFSYSNSGYVLLAMIIEKVSGESYAAFLKKHILDPLAMHDTFVFDRVDAPIAGRARGYGRFGEPDDYNLLTVGEGGVYSSVEDLFRWDQALYSGRLVRQSTLAEAFRKPTLNNGSLSMYGFGWAITEFNGDTVYSHAGRYGGFNTYIKRFPKERNTVIFLTNHGFRNMSAIGDALIAILHGKSYGLPKLSIAELMYAKYEAGNIDSAVQLYHRQRQSGDTDCDFSESELNELGYRLLSMKKFEDAIRVLRLNAEEFPNSWNVYDGLGEAYMDDGENDLAVKNYQKSLELNPQNTNAVAMLRKLRGR